MSGVAGRLDDGWLTCKPEQAIQHVRVERLLKTVEKVLKSVEI